MVPIKVRKEDGRWVVSRRDFSMWKLSFPDWAAAVADAAKQGESLRQAGIFKADAERWQCR